MNVMSRPAEGAGERRTVTILGSTGSVGCNTVSLLAEHTGAFEVEALTAGRNAALLAEQGRRLGAKLCVVADPAAYRDLKDALGGTGIEAAAGREGLLQAAGRPADCVIAAIVGAAGLEPTWQAIRAGTVIGLANKECLVCAGGLMTARVAEAGAALVPVDSEHSAIFQVFDFEHAHHVEGIILTASGGPFRTQPRERLAAVTPQQAVAHPNWAMGAKISVDSATMMNKGLELIEAFHLFPVRCDQIEIVIHPQSIVHSLVAYVDGSVLAQLGSPDMRTPIAYALAWPRRIATAAPRLRLADVAKLTFEAPDEDRFPALRLAREALQAGASAPAVLNAANEVAVHAFLSGEISFLDMTRVVEGALERADVRPVGSLGDVIDIDAITRERAAELVAACRSGKRYASLVS
jgi:1-deoxy-D-xylulose-5-phosphate reductoisomerase